MSDANPPGQRDGLAARGSIDWGPNNWGPDNWGLGNWGLDKWGFGTTTSLLLWPLVVTAAAGNMLAAQAEQTARLLGPPGPPQARLPWSAPNHVRLELSTMELRDFSVAPPGERSDEQSEVPTLICAPYALHGAVIADLAPGHSLVEALSRGGCRRLFLTDWRSATEDMRQFTIDTYLAELNVAVDEIGAPVNLVGLCQGGWMALVFAARFPDKVRKLAIAGAPVDTEAAGSTLSVSAQTVPLGLFDEIAHLDGGLARGARTARLWEPGLRAQDALAALQLTPDDYRRASDLCRRFEQWAAATIDLPGSFYHQVVQWLFKENRLAQGRMMALGRPIDLAAVRHPLFLLTADHDEVTAPAQLLALRNLAGTPAEAIRCLSVPGGHLSLFVGARTLGGAWGEVAAWLVQDSST